MNMAIKPERKKPIIILKVRRTRKTIEIAWEQGDAAFDLAERDNPLPAFDKAFARLAELVPVICHFSYDYSKEGLRVVGLKLGHQGGARTVVLLVRKDLSDAAKEFAFATPERLLEHPDEPGKYTPPLDEAGAEAVNEAIEQAKRYVQGDRAQGQIEFDEDDEDGEAEPAEGEELPLGDEKKSRKTSKK
jgi:hypothetical protein